VTVQRSLALWNSFEGPKALISRGDWVDPPSVGIPNLYTITGLQLADVLERTGRAPQAQGVYATARGVAAATRQLEEFGFNRVQAPVTPNENVLQNLVPTSPGAPAAAPDSAALTGTQPRPQPR
jgi:hypothetical protein